MISSTGDRVDEPAWHIQPIFFCDPTAYFRRINITQERPCARKGWSHARFVRVRYHGKFQSPRLCKGRGSDYGISSVKMECRECKRERTGMNRRLTPTTRPLRKSPRHPPSVTPPPTSVDVIVWCGDTPVVLRSLGDQCERHKRASRACSARFPASPKGASKVSHEARRSSSDEFARKSVRSHAPRRPNYESPRTAMF